MTNDIETYTPEEITSKILNLHDGFNYPNSRGIIFIAEDTAFTIEQSKQLAPYLLNFALKYRDSDDPDDKGVVHSAIRTGASMLKPAEAKCLIPLLQPGHCIETSLVAMKMIGRIFEAQPPKKMDEYKELSNVVFIITMSLLNPYAIISSKIAAMAQLGIYALAAMASSKIQEIVEVIILMKVDWFTKQTFHHLCDVRKSWVTNPVYFIDVEQEKMMDSMIETLK